MARNGSGVMNPVTNSWNPQVNGALATGPDFLALYTDLINAITQSVSSDGQTPITGNLQMGGNKITGLGAGTGTGQSLRWEQLFDQGVETDIASAATTDIGTQNSNFLRITGTTGITSFGTTYRGPRFLRFAGALTLTNSATLVLPGGANITTAAGDTAIAYPIGNPANGWVIAAYRIYASSVGTPVLVTGGTMTGDLTMSGASIIEAEGASVAAAATTNIWATDGNTIHITGNTTITSFGTALQAGAWMKLVFDGTPLLTQSANLNLNAGGSDVQIAADDVAFVYADSTTQMDVFVFRKSGRQVIDVTPNLSTISASGNFVTPANTNTTTTFQITLVAAGGGGGASTGNSVAGGGGAGGAARFLIKGLAPGTSCAFVLGGSGAGASGSSNGGTGGTTQVTINGTVYSVSGGVGGAGTVSAAVNLTANQGTPSASILALPNQRYYQSIGSPGVYNASGASYIGSNGGYIPFGTQGFGGYTGTAPGSSASGLGCGGGGGLGGGAGGNGSGGIAYVEWSV